MLNDQRINKQRSFFDYWDCLGDSKRRMLDKSWSGIFRYCLLDELPLDKLKTLFSSDYGRPSKNLHIAVGALILQQLHDLTDQQAVEAVAFNIAWHYALDIQNDKDAFLCERTLRNYRRKVIELGLDKEIFAKLTDDLVKKFNVNTSLQRIDSTAIRSAMKSMTRLGAMVASIRKFLRELKRIYPSLIQKLGVTYEEEYLAAKSKPGCFDLGTPSETRKFLPSVAQDIFKIIEIYKNTEASQLESYKILIRLFGEQCTVTEDDYVVVKEPKDVPCDNVQNPSDPDSSYNTHKGRGYMVQVMESYLEDDGDGQEKSLDLITHVAVHAMTLCDTHQLSPALSDVEARGLKPKALLGDSHYGSRENLKHAAALDVELVSPAATAKGAKKGDLTLDNFKFNSEGYVTECPLGEKPISCSRGKNRFLVRFANETCRKCPYANNCAVTAAIVRGEGARIQYDPGRVEYSLRRQFNQSDEFKSKYRWRAGIEATMSRLKYQMNLGHLRVRGKKSIQYAVYLRALGLNIARCVSSSLILPFNALLAAIQHMSKIFKASQIFLKNLFHVNIFFTYGLNSKI